ncbi:hypothetical protein MRX96_014713 [Rhipicephalus microplus]
MTTTRSAEAPVPRKELDHVKSRPRRVATGGSTRRDAVAPRKQRNGDLRASPRPRHQRGPALVRCVVPTWTSSYAVASLAISLPSPDVDAGPKSRSRVRRAGTGVDGDDFRAP